MFKKKIFFFCLITSVVCCGIFLPCATAAGDRISGHTPVDQMLEFSLRRLKESVEKTKQKNERFSFENKMLRKGIEDLQKIKEDLSLKSAELSGRSVVQSLEEKWQFRNVKNMGARKERTQELIAIFQQDIGHLEEKARVLDSRLSEEGFDAHRKMLLKKKAEGGRNLLEAKKRFESLEKRNLGPFRKIEALKDTQRRLVGEIEALQYRLNGF